MDGQYLDNPSPDESTGELSGRSERAPIKETLVREMPVFEGPELDVVGPEPAHEGDGTTFYSMAPTNKPIERPERKVQFAHDTERPE